MNPINRYFFLKIDLLKVCLNNIKYGDIFKKQKKILSLNGVHIFLQLFYPYMNL